MCWQALAPVEKKKRRASIQSAKTAAEAEANAEEEAEETEENGGERPGMEKDKSKKGGSMFNIFKRSNSKDAANDAAMSGTLHARQRGH